jgi:hypothetical protein
VSEIRPTVIGEVIARRAAVATLGFDTLNVDDPRRLIAVTSSVGKVGAALDDLFAARTWGVVRSDAEHLVHELVELAAFAVAWAERLDAVQ